MYVSRKGKTEEDFFCPAQLYLVFDVFTHTFFTFTLLFFTCILDQDWSERSLPWLFKVLLCLDGLGLK